MRHTKNHRTRHATCSILRRERSTSCRLSASAQVVVLVVVECIAGSMRADDAALQTKQEFEFQQPHVSFSNEFPGARLNDCFRANDEYHIVIRPEHAPANNSAWYAFRVRSQQSQTIKVRLLYEGGRHRYVPKTSRNRVDWQRLPADAMRVGRRDVVMTLEVGPEPLWVSAQELITSDDTIDWIEVLAVRPFVQTSVIGRSAQDRPIYKLDIGNMEATDAIFIMARQHPPEVTGAIGMMHFVDTICGDTSLAKRFRQGFHVVAVPLANPDGVEHGHWRCNARGADLNRDWEDFEQPETRALRDELLGLGSGGRLHLFLDFHSTFHDVFYTHADNPQVTSFGFTWKWMASLQRRFPSYDVRRETCQDASSTSRSWVNRTFGIPAITFEFGDRAPRPHIERISSGSAEEMMRLMLAKAEWQKGQILVQQSASESMAGGE